MARVVRSGEEWFQFRRRLTPGSTLTGGTQVKVPLMSVQDAGAGNRASKQVLFEGGSKGVSCFEFR